MRDPTVRIGSFFEEAIARVQHLLEPVLGPKHPWRQRKNAGTECPALAVLAPEHPWRPSEGRKRVLAALITIVSPPPEGVLKQGPGRRPNTCRDFNIAVAVAVIASEYGLRPTRHRGNDRSVSASFIVATALAQLRLGMGEAAVEKIWERGRSQLPLPPRR
jgi:hypothetical protein